MSASAAVVPLPRQEPLAWPSELLTAVTGLTERLQEADLDRCLSQEERAAMIAGIETLKCAAEGAQAALTVDLHEQAAREREARQDEFGHRRREREGVTLEVSLARRVSPHRARALVDLARALEDDLPHTRAALREGRIGEYAASLVHKVTAPLTPEERRQVDEQLAPRLGTISERRLEKAAQSLAYEVDKRSYLERMARATLDRYVSVRPAPEGMARLSALLPMVEGVAVHAALSATAKAIRAGGDERTQAQVCADELVRRVTTVDPHRDGMPVEVGLVMTDAALFADADDPGRVPGFGPVPAVVARRLALTGSTRRRPGEGGAGGDPLHWLTSGQQTWIRRIFLDPVDSTGHRGRPSQAALRRSAAAADPHPRPAVLHALLRRADRGRRPPRPGP